MFQLRISLTFILLILSLAVKAQEESGYAVKYDSTIHNKWAPSGVRFGIDIAGPIYNLFEPKISNFEATADIDFSKFFVVVEMGQGAYNSTETITNYTNSGYFFRFGADVNMTSKDANLNALYFGLRYATSSFSEKLLATIPDSGWGETFVSEEQDKSRANWVEMNIGMRIRISNSFFAGYVIRFKLLKHNTYSENKFEPYFIPGYGVASNKTNWGLSYFIQYRIKWKKKPITWRED